MSRAFIVAVALHVIGVAVLVLTIRYWPTVTPVLSPAPLELVMAAPRVPAPGVVEPSILARAVAAVSSESRPVAVLTVPIPEVRPVAIPEPTVAVSPIRDHGQSETFQRPESVLLAEPGVSGGHPLALSQIQPRYPYSARVRARAGKVTIHLRVTRQGEVESAVVSQSSGFPALDASALVSARKARFKPAEKNGQPVPSVMDLQFDFRLQD